MSFFSSLKTLLLTTAIVLCCSTPSFAAPVFSASTTNATITATVNGVSSSDKIFLYYKTTPFDQETLKTAKEVSGSTLLNTTFFSVVVAENTTYYVRAGGVVEGKPYLSPSSTLTTGVEISAEKLVFEEPAGNCKSIYINGKILNANRKDYEVILKYYNTYEQGTEPHEARPQHGSRTQPNTGIADDGTYSFYLSNLTTGNTKYFVTQTIRNPKTGAVATEQGEFFSCKGNIAGTTTESDDFNKRSYRFLAPISIPGLGTNLELLLDHDLCLEQAGADATKQDACNNQIGDFINLILRVLISFAAVFLVVQIIIKGYQYMVTDIPKFKINAKERVFEAFGGLLLALSSYLILNTINPRLLTGTIGITTLDLAVENFELSALQSSRTGITGTKVNFKKEACPAAMNAEKETKVPAALLLAIFDQETGSGRNTGACFPLKANSKGQVSNMPANQVESLRKLISGAIDNINVSCDPGEGTGGAIGKMQSMPASWIQYYGLGGDPWSTKDAMIFTAKHLIAGKIFTDGEQEAACRYWGGNGSSCASKTNNGYAEKYGKSVIGKRITYQKRIDAGDCK